RVAGIRLLDRGRPRREAHLLVRADVPARVRVVGRARARRARTVVRASADVATELLPRGEGRRAARVRRRGVRGLHRARDRQRPRAEDAAQLGGDGDRRRGQRRPELLAHPRVRLRRRVDLDRSVVRRALLRHDGVRTARVSRAVPVAARRDVRRRRGRAHRRRAGDAPAVGALGAARRRVSARARGVRVLPAGGAAAVAAARPDPPLAERLQRVELLGRRLPGAGLAVRAHLLGPRRAGDHRRDGGHGGEAADREREERHAALVGEPPEALEAVPALLGDLAAGETSLGRLLAADVLAGEEAAREREVGEHPDAEPFAGGEDLVLDPALDERVVVLRRDEAGEAALARGRVRLLDLGGGEVRGADVAHLAFLHELVQRTERLLDRRPLVGLVHLVDVDHVGTEPSQRALGRPTDVFPRAAPLFWPLVHRLAELRRDDDPVASALERAADVLLARPLRVDVGRVEERDAGVERRVDDGERLLVVAAAAEVVRAEADDRDLRPALAQVSCAHGATLPAGGSSVRRSRRIAEPGTQAFGGCSPFSVL